MRCPKIIPSTMAVVLAAGILTAAPAAQATTFYGQVSTAAADTQAPTLVSIKRLTPATVGPADEIKYSWTVDDIGTGMESISLDVIDSKGDAAGSSTTILSSTATSTGVRTVGETTLTPNRVNMKPGQFTVKAILLTDKAGNSNEVSTGSTLSTLGFTLQNPNYDDAMPTIVGSWTKKTYAPGERAIFNWTLTDANVRPGDTYTPRYRLAEGVYLYNVIASTTGTKQSGYSYYDIPLDADYGTTLSIADSRVYDAFNIWTDTTEYRFPTASIDDAAHPVSSAKPAGNPAPGQKLTVDTSAWKGATVKVTWNAGVNSKQATVTASSFTFPTVESGYAPNTPFTVKVTGTWADNTVRTRTYTGLSQAYAAPSVQPGSISIAGTAAVGQFLTATTSGWPAGYKLIGQWKYPDHSPAAPVGATVLPLDASHAGKAMQFCVTAISGALQATGSCSSQAVERGTMEGAATVHWDKGFKTVAVVGDTATMTFPVPKVDGSTVRYEWLIDNVVVPGATGKTFKIPANAAGKPLRGRAVVTAPGYNSLYSSTSTRVVLHATVGDAPIVSGSQKVGATLTAKAGAWTSKTQLAYLWHRDGEPLWGHRTPTYTQVAADLGKTLTVKVTATRQGAETVHRFSEAKGKTQLGSLPAAKYTVTGNAKQIGNRLAATQSTPRVPGQSVTYQWHRNGKPIKGAIWSTYKTTKSDARTEIRVKVTMKAPGYTGSRVHTSNTVKVAPGSLRGIKATIKGKAASGNTVSVSRSNSTSGTTYKYQWFKNGKPVKNATRYNFKVTQADLGAALQARLVLSKPGYHDRTVYTQKVKIPGKRMPASTVTLKGTVKVGKSVSVSYTKPQKGARYSVQWHRNNKPIKGATKASYKLTKADRGTTLKVTVTGKKSGFFNAHRSVTRAVK